MPERKEISYSVQKQPLPSILIADADTNYFRWGFLFISLFLPNFGFMKHLLSKQRNKRHGSEQWAAPAFSALPWPFLGWPCWCPVAQVCGSRAEADRMWVEWAISIQDSGYAGILGWWDIPLQPSSGSGDWKLYAIEDGKSIPHGGSHMVTACGWNCPGICSTNSFWMSGWGLICYKGNS